MRDLLWGAAGAALILVVAADIFRSLLVPRANTRLLRLGPVLVASLFPAWEAASRRIREPHLRQTVRATLAPLMMILSLLIWAGLLILGFGLIFWAVRRGFPVRLHDIGDAVFAAGTAFATLDVQNGITGAPARVATVSCALAGLATVTVVLTFLISVQSGFGRRETLVLRLESHVTLPPAGIAILETYGREEIVDRLAAFFDAWEKWAAEVAISHRAFPILLMFRSNDSRCEWLAAFGAVLDAAALLDASVVEPPAGAKAAAHFLLRTGARMLADMARLFAPETEAARPSVDEERFDAHRGRLVGAGYRLVADRDAALARFKERRDAFCPSLSQLARRLAIAVDERGAGDDDSMPREIAAGPDLEGAAPHEPAASHLPGTAQ